METSVDLRCHSYRSLKCFYLFQYQLSYRSLRIFLILILVNWSEFSCLRLSVKKNKRLCVRHWLLMTSHLIAYVPNEWKFQLCGVPPVHIDATVSPDRCNFCLKKEKKEWGNLTVCAVGSHGNRIFVLILTEASLVNANWQPFSI